MGQDGASWIAPDRQGSQYANGGDPTFYFIFDLATPFYVTALSVVNGVTYKSWEVYYRCDSYTISMSDDGASFGTEISGMLKNDKTITQLAQVGMMDRFLKLKILTYGKYSAALSRVKVLGYQM